MSAPNHLSLAPVAAAVPQAEPTEGTVLTRTLHVCITGTLANLAMAGPTGGTWRLVDGKQLGVFGAGGELDSATAANQLRTALVHELQVVHESSTFPIPIGVSVNCIPCNEVTDLGERYAYTVLPRMVSSTPQRIYQCDTGSEQGLQWRKDFPKWTAANLETEGVLNVENNPWVFVHQDHPVIALLRHNAGLIGCKIDEQPKIDHEWYKVTRQVLTACCQTLRAKVLKDITSNDLNLFQVQIKRLNSESWDDMTDVAAAMTCPAVDAEAAKSFLTTPYTYMARLQLKYELQPVA